MSNNTMLLKGLLSAETRIQTIFSLIHKPTQKAFNLLADYLYTDPNPVVRHEAAYVLGELKDKRAVPLLIHGIENDQNRFVIHEATLALANLGYISYEQGKETIESLLNHPDTAIVDTAVIALQRYDWKLNSESNFLCNPYKSIKNYDPENKEQRIQACFKLMAEASEEAIDNLIIALENEPCDIVKHEIIFALGESISHKAIPKLVDVLYSKKTQSFSLHEALLALATLGDKRTTKHILHFFNHPDSIIEKTAKIAYQRLCS